MLQDHPQIQGELQLQGEHELQGELELQGQLFLDEVLQKLKKNENICLNVPTPPLSVFKTRSTLVCLTMAHSAWSWMITFVV